MKMFNVTITERLERVVMVEAEDLAEAEEIVNEAWNKEEYVLEADDFVEANFQAEEA